MGKKIHNVTVDGERWSSHTTEDDAASEVETLDRQFPHMRGRLDVASTESDD